MMLTGLKIGLVIAPPYKELLVFQLIPQLQRSSNTKLSFSTNRVFYSSLANYLLTLIVMCGNRATSLKDSSQNFLQDIGLSFSAKYLWFGNPVIIISLDRIHS